MPCHPLDEHECDKLIAKQSIDVECVILIGGFEEHGVAELLDFYKLRPFIQLTQECYPTPVRAFYSNIRNVDEEKYSFHTSFKRVIVRVSPSLIGHTFSLEIPKKAINFCIPEIDIKAMSNTITKELCSHSFQLELDFKTLPYESIPRMQPMRMKMSIDKQTSSSSSPWHPDALPPTLSQTDNEEDGDDDGGDEEDEDASTDGEK
ncbi:hypothetical protein AAG906_014311 [Vitis piasezkii]